MGRPDIKPDQQLSPGTLLYDKETPWDSSYAVPSVHSTGSYWMIIGITWHQKFTGGYWEYVLLGPSDHIFGPIRNESVYELDLAVNRQPEDTEWKLIGR